jgi:protein translocase SEC61 complex gamma subunit
VSDYPKYDKYSKRETQGKHGIYERIGMFFQNSKRILKVANKPKRKDYFLVFKICGIGLVVLGAVSYVLQLIFSLIPIGS